VSLIVLFAQFVTHDLIFCSTSGPSKLKSSIMNEEYPVFSRNCSIIGELDIGSWLTRKQGDAHKNGDFGSKLVCRGYCLYPLQTIPFFLQIYHLSNPEALNPPTDFSIPTPPYEICTTNQTYIVYICYPEYLQQPT